MSEDTPLSVLRRKAGARAGPPPAPRGMTAEKAFRQALTQTADGLAGLELVVREQSSDLFDQAQVIANLPDVGLFTLADGPADARGVIVFSSELVDAVIEVQTMARVDPATRTPRPTTRIDAALTRDFVESVLTDFGNRVAKLPEARWARGFHYGTYVSDPTPLTLMLEEGDYRVQELKMELGGGAKHGRVWLALPAVAAKPAGPSDAKQSGSAAKPLPPADPVWAGKLYAATAEAPVKLHAELARITLPLYHLQRWAEGTIIPIPRTAIADVGLVGARPAGRLSGRLGQQNGMRAVRLNLDGVAPEIQASAPSASTAPPPPAEMPPPVATAPLDPIPPVPDDPLPDLPSLPDLPDLPAMASDDGLPDLPTLPDLPDLPDLPALPDIG